MRLTVWLSTLVALIASVTGTLAPVSPEHDTDGNEPTAYSAPAWLEQRLEAVGRLRDGHEYREAEVQARSLLSEVEARAGADSVETATVIDALIEVVYRTLKTNGPELEQLARRAVEIKMRELAPDDPAIASSLERLGKVLLTQHQVAEPMQRFEQALEIKEAAFGSDDPRLIGALRGVAQTARLAGDGPLMVDSARRALGIVDVTTPDDAAKRMGILRDLAEGLMLVGETAEAVSVAGTALELASTLAEPPVHETLNLLGVRAAAATSLGMLQSAREDLERACQLAEMQFGADSPILAMTLAQLGFLLNRIGELDDAESTLLRALSIKEQAFGEDSTELNEALVYLVGLYEKRGDFDSMRRTSERAIAIAEKNYPPGSYLLLVNKVNLSGALKLSGDLEAARRMEQEVLDGAEASGLEKSELALAARANLCLTLQMMSRLVEARDQCERALELGVELYGPDSPYLLMPKTLLGLIAYTIGDFRQAEQLLQETLDLEIKLLGEDSPALIQTLGATAEMHVWAGNLERAYQVYQRALTVAGPVFDDSDESLAELRTRTAAVLIWLGRPDEAEPLLALSKEAMLSSFPYRQLVWHNHRADLHLERGELDLARQHYRQVVELQRSTLGFLDAGGAEALAHVAVIDWSSGDTDAAIARALEAEEAAIGNLDFAARLTEREALTFEFLRAGAMGVALGVLTTEARDPSPNVGRVWERLIASRGRVLDLVASRHRQVVRQPSPEVRQLMHDLDAASTRLATWVSSGDRQSDDFAERMRAAREDRYRAEQALIEASEEYRSIKLDSSVGLDAIERALPRGAALVAYVKYRAPGRNKETKAYTDPLESSYAAMILDASGKTAVVPLGSAIEIDTAVERWRLHMGRPSLSLGATKPDRRVAREAGSKLRKAIWDPLARHLEGTSRVFVVPDGALNLVNLATLPARDGSYLLEGDHVLHYLSAERDLVRSPAADEPNRGLLLVGDPDYGHAPLPIAQAMTAGHAAHSPVVGPETVQAPAIYRSSPALCTNLAATRFDSLPGTLREVDDIANLWTRAGAGSPEPMVRLVGNAAGEEVVKRQAGQHRIVHLATHGYFVRSHCRSTMDSIRADARTRRAFDVIDSSMLLSGLVLAGANLRGALTEDSPTEDGILTAEEIAHLDLTGTEWVVLSACDTGIGDVLEGEGVFGLRRGFRIAGAGSLIMSLWRVQDEASREWMRALYEHRLAGASTADAVHAASLHVLEARRADGRSTHPYYWGAFVASGDWR